MDYTRKRAIAAKGAKNVYTGATDHISLLQHGQNLLFYRVLSLAIITTARCSVTIDCFKWVLRWQFCSAIK